MEHWFWLVLLHVTSWELEPFSARNYNLLEKTANSIVFSVEVPIIFQKFQLIEQCNYWSMCTMHIHGYMDQEEGGLYELYGKNGKFIYVNHFLVSPDSWFI